LQVIEEPLDKPVQLPKYLQTPKENSPDTKDTKIGFYEVEDQPADQPKKLQDAIGFYTVEDNSTPKTNPVEIGFYSVDDQPKVENFKVGSYGPYLAEDSQTKDFLNLYTTSDVIRIETYVQSDDEKTHNSISYFTPDDM
jgi:hypothetical protein